MRKYKNLNNQWQRTSLQIQTSGTDTHTCDKGKCTTQRIQLKVEPKWQPDWPNNKSQTGSHMLCIQLKCIISGCSYDLCTQLHFIDCA